MKLSVILLTFGLATLANGDYTNPHWQAGLFFAVNSIAILVLKCVEFRSKWHGPSI